MASYKLPWIALLALSISIVLVSSSARVTSVKSQKGLFVTDIRIPDPKIGPQVYLGLIKNQNILRLIVGCWPLSTVKISDVWPGREGQGGGSFAELGIASPKPLIPISSPSAQRGIPDWPAHVIGLIWPYLGGIVQIIFKCVVNCSTKHFNSAKVDHT